MYKRESSSNGRKGGSKPFVKTTAAKKTGSSGTRSGKTFDKPSGKGFGEKGSFGKTTRGEDKSFDKAPRKTRSYGADKPEGRGYSGRKAETARPRFGESDASKSFERAPRKTRSYGDERPAGKSFSDRKPSGARSRFTDKDESKSFGKGPRKPHTFGDKPAGKTFSDRKSSGVRSNFKDKEDTRSFEKIPRKTRSFGDERPKFESKNPKATNPYNRTPRKLKEDDRPTRFGDRKNTREDGERRATKSFTYDDQPRSRSGRGPRKGETVTEKKKAQKDETPQTGNVRLNRYIANAGVCSRREADDLILAGLVTVNGVAIEEMGYQVKPTDDVRYNGERLSREKKVYVLLNKPKDAITTLEDPEGRRTVMQLFGNALGERIYPVGRLDRNTTGVLLFTNDGDLAQRLMHPKYEMKKVYKATLDKTFKGEDMWQLTNGVELEDGFIKPDAVAFPNPKDKKEVGIEIHSGKNHIIHRIFESLGYKVDKLDRALYGGLTKGKLKRGEWRELTEKEVNALKRTLKMA